MYALTIFYSNKHDNGATYIHNTLEEAYTELYATYMETIDYLVGRRYPTSGSGMLDKYYANIKYYNKDTGERITISYRITKIYK